ncbi:hypothetical protein DFS34DRAFT_392446 [Phlyctochytrium arcticum]|nr:hypothetical protein DFS34DRAFT_392446 [Phlyctochytrium arcticum]
MSTAELSQKPNSGRTPPTSAGASGRIGTRPGSSNTPGRAKSAGKGDKASKKAGTPGSGGVLGSGLGDDSKKEDTTPTDAPLTWALFTMDDLAELRSNPDVEAIINKIAKVLGMSSTYKEDLLHAIAVKFTLGNYLFACEAEFSDPETAAFCAIMKSTFEQSIEKSLSIENATLHFRDTLLAHTDTSITTTSHATTSSAQTPASPQMDGLGTSIFQGSTTAGWNLFSPESVVKIVDYVVSSFFQHYRLYTYVFTTEQPKEDIQLNLHIESLPAILTVQPSTTESARVSVTQRSEQVPLTASSTAVKDVKVGSSPLLRDEPQPSGTSLHAAHPPAGGGAGPGVTGHPPVTGAVSSDGQGGEEVLSENQDAVEPRSWPPPLGEAIPLAEWEEQQRLQRAEEERKRIEEEQLKEEERKAAENPFAMLNPDSIKQLAAETISHILTALTSDVERAMEEQRTRFLERIGTLK